MYLANRRLKVGHDEETDTPIYREFGDVIPEADTWPWHVTERYVSNGIIQRVAVAPEPAKSRAKG